jgi:hypothetical protein
VVETDPERDLAWGVPTHQEHESTRVCRGLESTHEGPDGVDLAGIVHDEEEQREDAPADFEKRQPVAWPDPRDDDLGWDEEDGVAGVVRASAVSGNKVALTRR